MSKTLKKYKARIFDDVYTVLSDDDDAFVSELIHKVDSSMKEIAAAHSMLLDSKKIAVLAALKATEELLILQQTLHQEQAHSEKIMSLLSNEEEITL